MEEKNISRIGFSHNWLTKNLENLIQSVLVNSGKVPLSVMVQPAQQVGARYQLQAAIFSITRKSDI